MAERNLYLRNTSLQEAYDTYLGRCDALVHVKSEIIAAENALGRTTAKPVYAAVSSPAYNAAAMDGIAVCAASTSSASELNPVTLVPQKDFIQIDTGDPLFSPFDAVIMAEDVVELEDGSVQIRAAASPWQHIRPISEDFAQGEMIVPSAHVVRPVDIGLMLSGGVFELAVCSKPSVAIIPTGTELIDPEELAAEVGAAAAEVGATSSGAVSSLAESGTATLSEESADKTMNAKVAALLAKPGAIVDSNSRMIAALVEQQGGRATRFPIASDDYESLKAIIKRAVAEHDMVLINAGSSAGREDFTAPLLAELGEVVVHGVAVKPGKPVILAFVEDKPVIGLPGYPLATYFNFTTFAAPVMALFTGQPNRKYASVEARISKRIVSSLKHREYVQVVVGLVDGQAVAAPLSRGAGVITSLARADGFIVIDQEREGVEAGETLSVSLYHDLLDVAGTILAVGSHDLALDILADILPRTHPHVQLRSTHVGSLAGLAALARGEAHLAPTHLLDEDTGVYNITAVKQMLGSEPVVLVKGLERIQGIMVAPGNPLGITGIEDLTGVNYINRQRGAGTRVLLDYKLKEAGIAPVSIKGYEREATTHMAVASAIAAGSADAGMGVYSAAQTLGLGFIEIGIEEYDFALPARFLELPHIQAFIEALSSAEFHARLDELGGYGYSRGGEIITLDELGG